MMNKEQHWTKTGDIKTKCSTDPIADVSKDRETRGAKGSFVQTASSQDPGAYSCYVWIYSQHELWSLSDPLC